MNADTLARPVSPMSTAITLVVLRCADIVMSKRFYEALGLQFSAERHGAGTEHWSCQIGEVVLELYPADQRRPSVGRLGFRVGDVRASLEALSAAGGVVCERSDAARRAVVADPDGTRIELTGAAASSQERSWSIWRQDDNGNRFLVSSGHARAEAERVAAEFEARGHKQMYWTSPDESP
jgi:lactoylglutathione lyase